MEKRGLSDVVTTVLIILLAIAAVAILGFFVLRTVRTSSENLETATTSIQLSIPQQYVKYDPFGNPTYVTLNVKRNAGEGKMTGLNIVIEAQNGTLYTSAMDMQIDEFESKQITINDSRAISGMKTIQVSPIFTSSSGKKFIGQTIASASVSSSSYLGTNLINPLAWKVGTTGSQPGFNHQGSIEENIIELGIGPFGGTVPLWKAGNLGSSLTDPTVADGGWKTSDFPIDPTKDYRYSVWMKKTGSKSSMGYNYLGLDGDSVTYLNGGATPQHYVYLWWGRFSNADKWYLVVGYIRSYHSPSIEQQGGIYDTSGNKIHYVSGNWGDTDYKFTSDSSYQVHMAFLYYETTEDALYLYGPRVDVVNGTEPTINQLLGLE